MEESRPGATITLVAYVLHLMGAVVGVPSLIGLIINYIKRGDDGAEMDSHHTWMIRTFWWAILWCVLIGLSYFVLVGFVFGAIGFIAVWIWYLYRHVRGLLCLTEAKPLPS